MTKKANHQANIVRIETIKEHTNADTLEIIVIGEYQVVSKKGQFKVGDLGVYLQPDSVVPQTEPFKFIWQPYFDDIKNDPSKCKHIDPATGPLTVTDGQHEVCLNCQLVDPFKVPEKKRRITVRKFRKEWSEGLLLPVSDFGLHDNGNGYCSLLETHYFKVGDDVSDFLKITHYDPDAGKETGETSNAPKLRKKYPKSLRGWYNYLVRRIRNFFGVGSATDGSADNISLGIPVYDVDALKNYPHTFEDGEQVIVTEKIHGSNARFLFLDGIQYAGSRNLWKSPSSNCIFRRALRELPWIEEWCRKHEGHVLWGEVTPTQGGFNYGSDKVQFFPFDIRTPGGEWLDKSHEKFNELVVPLIGYSVPVLYQGPYDLDVIKKFVDGLSTVPGAKHIREGVVIKTAVERHKTGVGRCQMKVVSNAYLEKDNK